jgi:Regulator of chromosome condensation (RCC1) repeat/Putative Ig domain
LRSSAGPHPRIDRRRTTALATLSALALTLAATGPAVADTVSSSPGELFAFGANRFGQLASTAGNGSEAANATPLPASLPGAEAPVVQLAAGDGSSFALTSDGRLYSFGENLYGELGRALGSGSEAANPTPARVNLPGAGAGERIVEVAAGGAHSLALTSTGQLYAFGRNFYGQLGSTTGNGSDSANPTPAPLVLAGASGPVGEIAAGEDHSLAVTSTGQLYAFGSNRFGQLGNPTGSGTELANPTPLRVSLPDATGPVVQVAAGFAHSLALTSTGQLYAFGSNEFGQLGSTDNSGTSNPTAPAPVVLPGATGPVSQIAAGAFHSLALTSTGQLYAFGQNSSGQLGSATGVSTPNPTPVLVALPAAAGPLVQIAAGAADTLLVTTSGRLLAFGSNEAGQLGSADGLATSTPNPTAGAPDLPVGTTIDAVAHGATAGHTLALVADLAVLDGTLPPGRPGLPYGASAHAAGGAGAYSWSASGLPSGLSIDPLNGQISGTPASAGVSDVVLHVEDRFGVGATSAPIVLTIAATTPTRAFISSTLTEAQIRSSLGMQLGTKGRQIKLKMLRKRRSYAYGFTALTPGALRIDWYYLPPGARLARSAYAAQSVKPVLFASGSASFATAGSKQVTLRLTLAGRKLLRHRKRIALSAVGSFTPRDKRTITATRSFSLRS